MSDLTILSKVRQIYGLNFLKTNNDNNMKTSNLTYYFSEIKMSTSQRRCALTVRAGYHAMCSEGLHVVTRVNLSM